MLNSSNAKAYAILAIVYDMFGKNAHILKIYPYINGRENGFHIIGKNSLCASFSESRNSDAIVIYFGTTLDFSMQGCVPNNPETYREVKYFNYNQYLSAANFIYKYLTDESSRSTNINRT